MSTKPALCATVAAIAVALSTLYRSSAAAQAGIPEYIPGPPCQPGQFKTVLLGDRIGSRNETDFRDVPNKFAERMQAPVVLHIHIETLVTEPNALPLRDQTGDSTEAMALVIEDLRGGANLVGRRVLVSNGYGNCLSRFRAGDDGIVAGVTHQIGRRPTLLIPYFAADVDK